MDKERRRSWDSLPVEIRDDILRVVIGRQGEPSDVMTVVLPFVCRAWNERKAFWGRPPSRRLKGKSPLWTAHAAALGSIPLLKWLLESGCPLAKGTIGCASEAGHLEIIKWWAEMGHIDIRECTFRAARGGHVEVFKWLKEEGMQFELEEQICGFAAQGNHLELLEWCVENGLKWHVESFALATGVKPHLMKWTGKRRCPFSTTEIISQVNRGDHEAVSWMRDRGCPWLPLGPPGPALLKGASLETLKWMKEMGCSFEPVWVHTPSQIFEGAAWEGDIEVLKWLRENGLTWNERALDYAATAGNLEALKWFYSTIPEFGEDSMCYTFAAEGGHLEVLKWLKAVGCPHDDHPEWISASAAMGGHLDALKWLKDNGFQLCKEATWYAASKNHLEMLKWLRENGCEWSEQTCAAAAKGGALEALKWLREHECPWKPHQCLQHAEKKERHQVVAWISEVIGTATEY